MVLLNIRIVSIFVLAVFMVSISVHGQEDALHDPASIHKLSAILEREAPPDFCWEIRKMGESGYRSAESLKDGLLSVFDGWYYPADSLYNSGFKGIENHAKVLSERFGYSINVTDLLARIDLIIFGYRFLEHGNPGEAISLFKYAVDNYPGSWVAHYYLAEAYMKNGETPLHAAQEAGHKEIVDLLIKKGAVESPKR